MQATQRVQEHVTVVQHNTRTVQDVPIAVYRAVGCLGLHWVRITYVIHKITAYVTVTVQHLMLQIPPRSVER